jgi:hypothetical protein
VDHCLEPRRRRPEELKKIQSALLEQVVEDLRSLSREEQDRAARILLTLLDGPQDDFRLMA